MEEQYSNLLRNLLIERIDYIINGYDNNSEHRESTSKFIIRSVTSQILAFKIIEQCEEDASVLAKCSLKIG